MKHLKTCRQALEDRAGIAKEQRRDAIKARAASSSPALCGKSTPPFQPSPGPLSEAEILRQREQGAFIQLDHLCRIPCCAPLHAKRFESDHTFTAEAAAFFAQNLKPDSGPKAPSPFSVLVSAAIKGADQKIFRHHDSSLASEDIILLFDLLAGQSVLTAFFALCSAHQRNARRVTLCCIRALPQPGNVGFRKQQTGPRISICHRSRIAKTSLSSAFRFGQCQRCINCLICDATHPRC